MDLTRRINRGPYSGLLRNIAVFALANFVVFAAISMAIGGDALSGKVEGGHYFVANHGRFTEVSAAAFTYSLWHARSLFVTHPLAVICWWFAYYGGGSGSGTR